MSLLTIMQRVTNVLGLPEPSVIVNNNDNTVKQLLNTLYEAGDTLRDEVEWPQLSREYAITLVADQAAYRMPTDFDRQIFDTHWARNEQWPLIGPISAQEYVARKEGIFTSGPRQRFRIWGMGDEVFYIDPTPGSGDAGNVVVFEYQTKQWAQPKRWKTAIAWGAGTYCTYDGRIYLTNLGGTSGVTAPTTTDPNVGESDGGVTWLYQPISDPDYLDDPPFGAGYYDEFLADTDTFVLDERLLGLSVMWRWMEQKGLEQWQRYQREYKQKLTAQASKLRGARTINLAARTGTRLLSAWNVPDTGYGS